MNVDLSLRLVSAGFAVYLFIRAWKGKNRRGMIDAALIGLLWVALLMPEEMAAVRYTVFGAALVAMLARLVKFELIDGTDKYAKAMAVGMLVFVASVIPVVSMSAPAPAWAKYLLAFGTITMLAALVWPMLWMGRITFSALRLRRDLKAHRPPREADEQALGIDLSLLRQPRE